MNPDINYDTSADLSVRGDVVLRTSLGDIYIKLFWQHAPRTCRNFFELARSQYYNGMLFHRVSKGFVIQSGDPTATGLGGESIYGKYFEDEIHKDLSYDAPGVVGMANTGSPNTNGSQFFITLDSAPTLNGKNTIFGQIESGFDVVRKIGNVATRRDEVPINEIRINKALIKLD